MACSAIATNCPAIVTSWSRLAYCRIVACCTGTVAALIESPRSPDSSPATGHSFWWWVAVGHRIARPDLDRGARLALPASFRGQQQTQGLDVKTTQIQSSFPALPSALDSH